MKYAFYFIILTLLTLACDVTSSSTDCQDVEVCTEEFRYVTTNIIAGSNEVLLDSIHTRNTKNDSIYNFVNEFVSDTNYHVVITDAQLGQIDQNGTLMLFEGFFENKMVFSEPYLIGHDCCHIVKLSGKDQLHL